MNKKVFLAAVATVGLIGLSACGSTESGGAQKVGENASAPAEKKEQKPQVFKVGDVVKLGDMQVTLKSAKFVNADQYTPAEKGAVLAIEFEAMNAGKDELYIGSEEFKISTPDGTQHEDYFGFDDGFMNENIASGKKITGKLYFDVPKDEKYEIVYKPTFTLSDDKATFEVIPQ